MNAKGHENYRVHCRLKELMSERGMTVEELHRKARIANETISQLRNNNFKGVSKRAIARICGALGITIGELFEVLPEDIWLPIRLAREVTVHFGSRSLGEPQPARSGEAKLSRQFIGSWDFRAFMTISDYLMGLGLGIRVHFKEHITGPGRGTDPAVRASAEQLFKGGNHIVVGSQIANQFTEEVVCHAYGVAPYNPQMRGSFPYGFVWDHWRHVQSSFGWQGQGKQFGIAALPSGKIVAPHVIVPSGDGSDGALILVYRLFQAPSQREDAGDVERIIMCFLGYGGLGTQGAACVATHPSFAAGLYPLARQQPRMRAVKCTYFRHPTALFEDNRELTSFELVPEHKNPMLTAPRPAFGSK
jgi:putative transcriptional regulator